MPCGRTPGPRQVRVPSVSAVAAELDPLSRSWPRPYGLLADAQVVVVFALNEVAADLEVKRMIKSLVSLASCPLKLFIIVNAKAKAIMIDFFKQASPAV